VFTTDDRVPLFFGWRHERLHASFVFTARYHLESPLLGSFWLGLHPDEQDFVALLLAKIGE
jgi:hypothetical protein